MFQQLKELWAVDFAPFHNAPAPDGFPRGPKRREQGVVAAV